MRTLATLTGLATCLGALVAPGATAQWIEFDEDPSRLVAAPDVGATDIEEKDFAWGDLDQDGDDDLVVVRKQPFTSTGRRTNTLFMNEGGVLVDRTAALATASDVTDDQGFLTPTNDRDVVMLDVNDDGWPDVVTATALTDNEPKHVSHPRVYINLGESAGAWLGLRYEDARIPEMHPIAGPRFAAVAAGDVTGDGAPDLHFSDYDSGGSLIFDYNDRLLVNDGNGFFTDETTLRLTPEMYESAFGIRNAIADMNGDGVLDIVRLTTLSSPINIGIIYNDPANEGFFSSYDIIYTLSPYEFGLGDLNGDGLLDVVVGDDGTDRYLLNQGNDAQGAAQFAQFVMPAATQALNTGNILIIDLDKDGHNDVISADVDIDIPGCNHRTFLFRNQGDAPNSTLAEEGDPIPQADLFGVHDVATIDLNDDGWLDLVLGRCTGINVWINDPPPGLVFELPGGTPTLLEPDAPTPVDLVIAELEGDALAPASARQHVSVDGGPFVASPLQGLGGNQFRAMLPAADCLSNVRFYFSADTVAGDTVFDPAEVPLLTYDATVATGTLLTVRDQMEGDVSGWTVVNDGSLTSGAWVAVDPNGTSVGSELANPDADATPGIENVRAFITGDDPPGASAGAADVDNGTTRLVSPVFDLAGTGGIVTYQRWFFTNDSGGVGADVLAVDVSNDGGANWTPVTGHETGGTGGAWEADSFVIDDFVAPTQTMRVRFSVSDSPNNSITEAGIDDFQIETLICESGCPLDLDANGAVGFADLNLLLGAWGPCPGCPADLDGNGTIGFADLNELLAAWGPCGG